MLQILSTKPALLWYQKLDGDTGHIWTNHKTLKKIKLCVLSLNMYLLWQEWGPSKEILVPLPFGHQTTGIEDNKELKFPQESQDGRKKDWTLVLARGKNFAHLAGLTDAETMVIIKVTHFGIPTSDPLNLCHVRALKMDLFVFLPDVATLNKYRASSLFHCFLFV